jgi:hypothetical protein
LPNPEYDATGLFIPVTAARFAAADDAALMDAFADARRASISRCIDEPTAGERRAVIGSDWDIWERTFWKKRI